jgi:hypothetical protein
MNRSNKGKIEADEINFIVSVAGFTLLDFKRNIEIQTKTKVKFRGL